jgi:putative salt-induced outer membrane protein YdiY
MKQVWSIAGVLTGAVVSAQASTVTTDLRIDTAAALAAAATAQPPVAAPQGDFWAGWKKSVELGVSGAEGNSENFNIRGAFGTVRDAADMTTSVGLFYLYRTENSEKSQSRGEFNVRNDWKFGESPWGFWAGFKAEYDEFQPWDWRLSAHVGPSYNFIKNDRTLLKGRAGLGASYELGGSAEEEADFEAVLGVDFSHKLTDRTRIFATYDFYPSLSNSPDYRWVGNAGMEVMVDPELNMLLKAGLQSRYDSAVSSPTKKHDLDYFLTLAWAF